MLLILYIIRNQNGSTDDNNETNFELIYLRAYRQPIAIHLIEKNFTNQKIQLQKNDCIYSFSDGFVDQFGGKKSRKFRSLHFKNLILSIQNKSMLEQKIILENTFDEWKGKSEQIDDVLVMGMKI